MGFLKFAVVIGAAAALSGCGYLDNDTERGLAGAATGAVVVGALGGSALAGAVAGGIAGAFCDDLNVAGCVQR